MSLINGNFKLKSKYMHDEPEQDKPFTARHWIVFVQLDKYPNLETCINENSMIFFTLNFN